MWQISLENAGAMTNFPPHKVVHHHHHHRQTISSNNATNETTALMNNPNNVDNTNANQDVWKRICSGRVRNVVIAVLSGIFLLLYFFSVHRYLYEWFIHNVLSTKSDDVAVTAFGQDRDDYGKKLYIFLLKGITGNVTSIPIVTHY
jgi:hypothetical protein